jgi:hypothetical protein
MDASLESLVGLYQFSPGRRLFALQQVHKVATSMKETELLSVIGEAITAERKNIELVAAYQRNRDQPKGSAEAQKIDWAVDRALGSLQEMGQALLKVIEPSDPRATGIQAMLHALFPGGLTAVTLLPYVEELAQLDRIVHVAQTEHSRIIAAIGAEPVLARLTALAQQFRTALEAVAPQDVRYDAVRATAAQCQNLLLQVTVAILAKHSTNDPVHVNARTALLQPILAQNEAIAQYLRARRPAPDVDPATGDELPAPAPVTPSA